ncbi:MAG: hypothetical protein JOY96_08220 [Verrucomicrobia bacterium]|nr:hypothetical protein [Verrucomicrobiota bacterium]MBV9672843.1 hypothetical protein [Verrucomicrobiota bacterium]
MAAEIDQSLRDEAWIGDAVLTLFVRSWLMKTRSKTIDPRERAALFELFVSNQFLSSFGEPTRVEAKVGRIYREHGLQESFRHLEGTFVDKFLRTARNKGFNL